MILDALERHFHFVCVFGTFVFLNTIRVTENHWILPILIYFLNATISCQNFANWMATWLCSTHKLKSTPTFSSLEPPLSTRWGKTSFPAQNIASQWNQLRYVCNSCYWFCAELEVVLSRNPILLCDVLSSRHQCSLAKLTASPVDLLRIVILRRKYSRLAVVDSLPFSFLS